MILSVIYAASLGITGIIVLCKAQGIQELAVSAGDDVTLPCTVQSDYPIWRGQDLQYNNNGQSSFSNPNLPEQKKLRLGWGSDRSSLIIRDVILSDQGLYECSVSKINLSVRAPPSPPVISNTETSIDGTLIFRTSESQPTSLVCISSFGYPQPLVQWYRGSTGTQPLTSSSTVVNETDSFLVVQTYTFTPQRQDDGVQYICRSSFLTGPRHIASTSAKLLLNLKPNPPTVVQSSDISAGNQAVVRCITTGSRPAANIIWSYKNTNARGEQTSTLDSVTKTYTVVSILKLPVTAQDNGRSIQCKVTHTLLVSQAQLTASINLNVQYPPLINPMSTKTYVEGDNVPFLCTASSKPVSMFKWYRDGQNDPLKEGNGTLEHNGLTYTIYNVRRTDAATYRCNANNGIETPDNKNVLLTVQYPPDVQPMTTNTSVNAASIVITCNATGVPNTGYKYGKWTQRWPGYDSSVRQYPDVNVIELQNLTYEHSGVYTCSASNGIKIFGTKTEFIEGSVFLIVESFPVVTNYTDKVSAKLKENVTVDVYYYSNVAETNVKINKNTISAEEESVIYSVIPTEVQVALQVFNHKIKTTGTKARIIIQIKSQTYLGFYDIVVSNKIGRVKRSLEIVPKGPPSVPSNLTVDNIQPNSVRVSWIAGYHGGAEQTFVIQISSDDVNWKNKSEVDGGLDESTDPVSGVISKLSASTTYYVRMYAYNKEGSSQFTDILNCTTSAAIETPIVGSALLPGLLGGVGTSIIVIVVAIIIIAWKKRMTPETVRRKLLDTIRAKAVGEEGENPSSYEDTKINESTSRNVYEQLQGITEKENKHVYDGLNKSTEVIGGIDKSQYEALSMTALDKSTYDSLETDLPKDDEKCTYENLKLRI